VRGLTPRQEAILGYILESISQKGRFPSFREIGRQFRLRSVATVAQHLDALVQKGCLLRDGRRLMPAPAVRRDRGVPIIGRVAAGRPISAIEHLEGQLEWETISTGGAFAVRVVGDSMIEEGIVEGDYAVVQPSEDAENGDLVVAYLGEEQEATVKRLHRSAGQVELRPANSNYRPIRVPPGDPTSASPGGWSASSAASEGRGRPAAAAGGPGDPDARAEAGRAVERLDEPVKVRADFQGGVVTPVVFRRGDARLVVKSVNTVGRTRAAASASAISPLRPTPGTSTSSASTPPRSAGGSSTCYSTGERAALTSEWSPKIERA